jgi:hypothetical protein
MKWNFFQTKKPQPNKPFLFFNHRARLQFGIYKKWVYEDGEEFLYDKYEILNGEGSKFYFKLEEIKNRNLIQYWCYFSKNGLGEMHINSLPNLNHISHDQTPKSVEEEYESYTGASWEERYRKMSTPNDEFRKEK